MLTGSQSTQSPVAYASQWIFSSNTARGSFLMPWIQAGIGPVQTTVGNKLREHYSINDFGASPANTAAQNVTAINLGIACLVALGGGTLEVPALGVYNINDEITVSSGVDILGYGQRSQINQTVAGKNIFIASSLTNFKGLKLSFSAAGNNLDFTKQNAIFASAANNLSVCDCIIQLKDINCGVQLRDCHHATISRNVIYGGVWDGVTAGAAASASDIVFYSATDGGRCVITENLCLSNNSQGIYFAALGFDHDTIISENICGAFDPTGQTLSANGGVRRHGIIASYSSGNASRSIITSNICLNTRWTGIYAQGGGNDTSGQITICENICYQNGFETANPLSAGIYITSNGGEVVKGNVIINFQNNIAATGGIVVNCPAVGGASGTKISQNHIQGSNASGIALGTSARDAQIFQNTLKNNALSDIYIGNSSDAGAGGNYISENDIYRNNTTSVSISLSIPTGTKRNIISRNKIRGANSGTLANTNCGIYVNLTTIPCDIVDNLVDGFYYGVNYASYFTASTRYFNQQVIDRNHFLNCTQGIGLSSNGGNCVVPLVDNIFDSTVTTPVGAGTLAATPVGVQARRNGTRLEVYGQSATPAAGFGTWIVGDRIPNQTPVVASPKAWVCTVAGSPGTWVSEGNL